MMRWIYSSQAQKLAATLGVTLCLGGILGGCGGKSSMNLVVISMDTTRADRFGAYGYSPARTPNIDALAKEGFLFHNHLTPVPLTLPAHTSLMTGHFPPTHSVHDNGTFIVPQDEITLAEVLSKEGYQTAAFVGAFPLAKQFGLDQGFDVYNDQFHANEADRRRGSLDIFFDERPASAVIDAAIAHHRERSKGPFFTFLHFFDPHQPQMPPAPYDIQFRNQPYDGEIAYVDEQLGRFFDFLKEQGDWENTLVVLTADHGEGLGEQGELTHALLLHQATLHIPLIMRGPGIPQGETHEWTAAVQLFSSILEYLSIAQPEQEIAPSHSLMPVVNGGGEAPPDYPRFTAYFETIAPRTTQGWSQLVGWMKDDWRLVHGPVPELYELQEDPEEQHNRFTEEPQIASGLFGELNQFLVDFETSSVGDSVGAVDQETLDRLAALGYLQASPGSLKQFNDMLKVDGMINPRDRVIDVSLFSEAKAAMARRDWVLAESLWQQVLARSPQNIHAYQGLAQLYAFTENWQRCFYYLDQALVQRPDATDLRRLRGEILVQVDRHQEGLDELLQLSTDSVQAVVWIGMAHSGLGQNDEAKKWFRKGLEIEPGDRWLRLYLANRLAAESAYEEAEKLYRSVIADAPYFHLAFYNYGKLLLDRGDRDQARGVLERASALAPQHEQTQLALRKVRAQAPSVSSN